MGLFSLTTSRRHSHDEFTSFRNFMPQIFEMMDAKARQDCIKEIDLLRVGECNAALQLRFITMSDRGRCVCPTFVPALF
jgi:hypothetical protein